MEGKHLNDYDLLRIFAILFVVIGHSAYLAWGHNFGSINYKLPNDLASAYNGSLLNIARYVAGWVYGFHMPLFFMLSGAVFGISASYSFDTLCKKKIKRLLVPHYLCCLGFVIPVKWLADFYNNTTVNVAYVNSLGGGSSAHLWFLLALFWVFIVFWIIRKISCGSMGFLFLLCLLVQLYHKYLPFNFLLFQRGMGYIIWFCIGYIFQKARTNFNVTKFGSITCFYLMTLAMFVETRYLSANEVIRILIRCAWIYSACVCILKLVPALVNNWIYKIVLRNCFYIYLLHDPLNFVVLKLAFGQAWLTSNLGCYAYLFCRTVGLVLVSIILGEAIVWAKNNFVSRFRSSMVIVK